MSFLPQKNNILERKLGVKLNLPTEVIQNLKNVDQDLNGFEIAQKLGLRLPSETWCVCDGKKPILASSFRLKGGSVQSAVSSKTPSIHTLKKCTSSKVLYNIILATVYNYTKRKELDFDEYETQDLINGLLADYDRRTGEGGYPYFTIADIHAVFQMGLRGRFGESSGHKYMLNHVFSWFDKYKTLKSKHLKQLKEQKEKEYLDKKLNNPNNIPAPPEVKEALKELQRKMNTKAIKKRKNDQITMESIANSKGLVPADFIKTKMAEWKEQYESDPAREHVTFEEYVNACKNSFIKSHKDEN